MTSAQCETKENKIFHTRLGKQIVMLAALTLILVLVGSQQTLAQTTFQHPGVLVSRSQLDFIKTQVANHVDPIYSAFPVGAKQ